MVGEKFDFSPVEDCVGNLIKKVNFKVRDEESYKNYQNFSKGTLAILESILQVFAYLDDDLRQAMTSKIEEADLRLKFLGFDDPIKFSPSFGKFVLAPFKNFD